MRREATHIRAARASDLDALLALEAHFPSDHMTRRAWRRFLTAPTAIALVAVPPHPSRLTPHALLGNLLLLTRRGSAEARVYSVIVAPEARGRGVGEALVAAGEKAAAALGCTAVSLEVRADNPAALGLYAKRDYQAVKRLPRYYDDGADGLRLVKRLR